MCARCADGTATLLPDGRLSIVGVSSGGIDG
jgi:hypothetical protein